MEKDKYFKCTNCNHYQYNTDFGQCEECGYENLVKISKEEYDKQLKTSKFIVEFEVDEAQLEKLNSDFENELNWLRDSGITVKAIYPIFRELKDKEPIEAIWLKNQIQITLNDIRKEHKDVSFSEQQIQEIIQELHNNHESIDQEIDWRVREFLGYES